MIYKVSELDFPRTNLRIYFAEICTILKIQTGENVLFFKCLTTDWPFSVCLYLTVLAFLRRSENKFRALAT